MPNKIVFFFILIYYLLVFLNERTKLRERFLKENIFFSVFLYFFLYFLVIKNTRMTSKSQFLLNFCLNTFFMIYIFLKNLLNNKIFSSLNF
jgi:hypothetical protein